MLFHFILIRDTAVIQFKCGLLTVHTEFHVWAISDIVSEKNRLDFLQDLVLVIPNFILSLPKYCIFSGWNLKTDFIYT